VRGLAVLVLAGSCGRETIDLAVTTDGQARPDGGDATPPDAGPCASNCKGGVCIESTGKCGTCEEDSPCAGNVLDRVCDTQTHECAMCTDTADCVALSNAVPTVCDQIAKRCAFPCSAASRCPLPLACDLERGLCVECTTAETCLGFFPIRFAPYCVNGKCVACQDEGDCGLDQHCLIGPQTCVQCFDDAHCAPDQQCDYRLHECVLRQE
jgi:hypothetical protein